MKNFRSLVDSVCKHIKQDPVPFVVVAAGLTVTILILAILAFQRFVLGWTAWADWTGFGDYTGPLTRDQRGKTLWNWLELLIIPAVLALAAVFFNRQERQNDLNIANERRSNDLAIADNRNQETTLQNYLDKMSELILKHNLRAEKTVWEQLAENDLGKAWQDSRAAARDMAQARTVTVLRQFNPHRRDIVLQFLRDANLSHFILAAASLSEADLSQCQMTGINLGKADLRRADLSDANLSKTGLRGAILQEADLSEAILYKADLSGANLFMANLCGAFLYEANLTDTNLVEADLQEADLSKANLARAILGEANLRGANLTGANLHNAILYEADLTGADLSEADLSGAILDGAKVSSEQLSRAASLEGTAQPGKTKHE